MTKPRLTFYLPDDLKTQFEDFVHERRSNLSAELERMIRQELSDGPDDDQPRNEEELRLVRMVLRCARERPRWNMLAEHYLTFVLSQPPHAQPPL